MKRIVICLLAAMAIGLSTFSVVIGAAETETAVDAKADASLEAAGYTPVTHQDGIELYVDAENCQLAVKNTRTGYMWRSDPENADDDEIAQGSIRMEMQAQLVVKFADNLNQTSTVNSYAACVRKGTFTITKIANGIEILYDFAREKENFSIPVSYTLQDGALVCRVLFSKIKERSDNRILEVRILPYFGAAYQNTEGYLFIPDGWGALADFQSNRAWAENYEKRIYGMDPALSNYIYRQAEECVRLPVFGICRGTNGFLAVVEEGAESGYITAMQAGKQSSYASASAGFYYRHTDELELKAAYSKKNKVVFLSSQTTGIDPTIRYQFLAGDNAGYQGMAGAYRKYLSESVGVKQQASCRLGPTLEILGAVRNRESFLGFMIERTRPVTTLDTVQIILTQLKEQNVSDIQTVLYYFEKKGTGAPVPLSPTIDHSLGGMKGFEQLQEQQKVAGNQLYLALDYVNIAGKRWGYWKFNKASKSLLKSNMMRYVYKPSTLQEDRSQWLSFYLRPRQIEPSFTRYLKKQKDENNTGICLSGMGSVVYTDFDGKTYSSRSNTVEMYRQAFEQGKKKGISTMADGANAYLFGYADSLTGVPLSSSGDLFTASVPFYQMALHGQLSISAAPLNRVPDMQQNLLRCLLTGTAFNFQLSGIPCEKLSDTVLQTSYNGYYQDWLADIAVWSKEFQRVHQTIGKEYLVDYYAKEGLETAVYADGTSITANLSADDRRTDKQVLLRPGEYCVYVPGQAEGVVKSTFVNA